MSVAAAKLIQKLSKSLNQMKQLMKEYHFGGFCIRNMNQKPIVQDLDENEKIVF